MARMGLGHQDAHVLPDQIRASITEEFLHRRIDRFDLPGLIDRYDPVHNIFHNGLDAGLACRQLGRPDADQSIDSPLSGGLPV